MMMRTSVCCGAALLTAVAGLCISPLPAQERERAKAPPAPPTAPRFPAGPPIFVPAPEQPFPQPPGAFVVPAPSAASPAPVVGHRDAGVSIAVAPAQAHYTEEGLRTFLAIFQTAATQGVENATIRAMNQIRTPLLPKAAPVPKNPPAKNEPKESQKDDQAKKPAAREDKPTDPVRKREQDREEGDKGKGGKGKDKDDEDEAKGQDKGKDQDKNKDEAAKGKDRRDEDR